MSSRDKTCITCGNIFLPDNVYQGYYCEECRPQPDTSRFDRE